MKRALCYVISVVMLIGVVFSVPGTGFLLSASAAWNGSTPGSQPSTFTVSGNNYYINGVEALISPQRPLFYDPALYRVRMISCGFAHQI